MHHALHYNGALDETGEEEEEEEEEDFSVMHRHYRGAEGGGRPGSSYGSVNNRELTQNEVDQVRFVLIYPKMYYIL